MPVVREEWINEAVKKGVLPEDTKFYYRQPFTGSASLGGLGWASKRDKKGKIPDLSSPVFKTSLTTASKQPKNEHTVTHESAALAESATARRGKKRAAPAADSADSEPEPAEDKKVPAKRAKTAKKTKKAN